MREKFQDEIQEYTFDSFESIIEYIQNHSIQILMLLTVFIIIYVIDHISNINAILFGMPSAIPNIPLQINSIHTKISKKGKKGKK
jgi:hypothetical protein